MQPMFQPVNKLTLGSTEFTNRLLSAKVTRLENGFDTATILIDDTSLYPSIVTDGTAIQLDVKNYSAPSYTTIFKGIVRFPIANISFPEGNLLTLSCYGAGYGLSEMLVAAEFGSQSINPTLDTITEIITDTSEGIIARYLNLILDTATSSGHSYSGVVASITDVIPYISFPYKPVDKCLNDLCDIATAFKAGSAGPHWIVTTDGALHLKLVNASGTGWTKYYGDSQANATLTYGADYKEINIEKAAPEANYIVYYGAWRRPSNGDAWTETHTGWDGNGDTTLSTESTIKKVGTGSVQAAESTNPTGNVQFYYPSGQNAAWNFNMWQIFNTPCLNFYAYRSGTFIGTITVKLCTTSSNYWAVTLDMDDDSKWYHFSLPIGPYFDIQGQDKADIWVATGAPDWGEINYVEFYAATVANGGEILIDGLHFGGAAVVRVAWNSDLPGTTAKMKLITDDIGKDDSLTALDDSGIMAQLAYAELLRSQTRLRLATVPLETMLPTALPGQWFYLQSEDYRCTKLIHTIDKNGYSTMLYLTDDLINGRSRQRYDDLNKVYASQRPEWQDRQASNIKAGQVDWRVTKLVKDYA
jgi:hypothetical protein